MPNSVGPKSHIVVKGARVNNLRRVDVDIPRNQLVVVTGLSGSGKSSLAFDTLYAEGQRRYVESLSAYARQFLGRINKPEVDFIRGIPPAIAIEQKSGSRNPRSTVGTSTEIYDYIKLLFARVGKTFSPTSGLEVRRHAVSDVVDFVASAAPESTAFVLAPFRQHPERSRHEQLEVLMKQGFTRVELRLAGGERRVLRIDELLEDPQMLADPSEILILVDRVRASVEEDTLSRLADSAQTAFYEGHGACRVRLEGPWGEQEREFSNQFEADGIKFEDPSANLFSFNNPLGACPRCEGFGTTIGIAPELVIPNPKLSLHDGAVACWKGEKLDNYRRNLVLRAGKAGFPVHKPYRELSPRQKDELWDDTHGTGINSFFAQLEAEGYKIQNRVMLARYRGKTLCPVCKGSRLRPEALFVRVGGLSIDQMVNLPIDRLGELFAGLQLDEHDAQVAKRLLVEIKNRLRFLCDVGLGYLTLNRPAQTLSGGESQRINLATSLGSSLVGSLYILDEPSIGLHARDTQRLVRVLRQLQRLGNTVLVVEHDEEIMRASDYLIDIGPKAGELGGQVVYQGPTELLSERCPESLTAGYLDGRLRIELPARRRKWTKSIKVEGAQENNLQDIDVAFPLGVLTVVTGVSGSGKSSLVRGVLYGALAKHFGLATSVGRHLALTGDLDALQGVEMVNQSPIGRSSRSNPATYVKAYDEIRQLMAECPLAVSNNFQPAHFSFNVAGGRCEECQGEGVVHVEMQFMADVELECESCGGKRFREEVLEVRYRGKNIHDILGMTVREAVEFFGADSKNRSARRAAERLELLAKVGLDYVRLGQSSSSLSGGESQRIKLASFLGSEKQGQRQMFLFDEPTTGLHFHDIRTLVDAFGQLIERGHTVVVIEHNLEVAKVADHIIDIGPDAGDKGGRLVFAGTPEGLARCAESQTGAFLREKLER